MDETTDPAEDGPGEALLREWFGPLDADGAPAPKRVRRWFSSDPAFDASLRAGFGDELAAALRGDREHWRATARGTLALVILLDQVTRNVARGRPEAFAGDARARAIAAEAVAGGVDAALRPIERAFLYMPFMHAESLADQERGVELFARLAAAAPAAVREHCRSAHRYAIAHRDIVARFGRFPHRNAALGRASTTEELEFLRQPGSSF